MTLLTQGKLWRAQEWVTADARKKFSDPQTFVVIEWVFLSLRDYLFWGKR